MDSFLRPLAAASMIVAGALASTAPASAQQAPIKIGIPTSIQLQVGRDTQNAAKMAIEEINAKGGLLGRKLEMVVADETENPEQGIAAIKKLTADDKVDVLIGGYTSRRDAGAAAAHFQRQDDLYRRRRRLPGDHRQGEDRLRELQIHLPRLPDQRRRIRPARWSISSTASLRARWA